MLQKNKGQFVINTLKKSDRKKGITLVVTCSKLQVLPFFFKSLKDMDLPREDMHLLVYDNTDDQNFLENLVSEIDEFLCPKCRQFRSIRLYKSYLPPKGTLTGVGNEIFSNSKISNIWHMWRKIKSMIYTDIFFQLEDDTIAPPDSFTRLYKILMSDPKIGFVTAIETGRNNIPYFPVRLGVHKVIVKNGFLYKRESFHPDTKGVQEIDAAGVYCFVARTKAYLSAFVDYDPDSKAFSIFAMDNVLTYNMKKHGWKLFADFDMWCGHLQVSFGRICIFTPEQALQFVDIWVPECNSYAISVEKKSKNQKIRRRSIRNPAPCFDLNFNEEKKIDDEVRDVMKQIKKQEKDLIAPHKKKQE